MRSVQPPSTWQPAIAPPTTPRGIAHNLPASRDSAAPKPPPAMPPKIDPRHRNCYPHHPHWGIVLHGDNEE